MNEYLRAFDIHKTICIEKISWIRKNCKHCFSCFGMRFFFPTHCSLLNTLYYIIMFLVFFFLVVPTSVYVYTIHTDLNASLLPYRVYYEFFFYVVSLYLMAIITRFCNLFVESHIDRCIRSIQTDGTLFFQYSL